MIHRQNIERVEEMIDRSVEMHAQRLQSASVQSSGSGPRTLPPLLPPTITALIHSRNFGPA